MGVVQSMTMYCQIGILQIRNQRRLLTIPPMRHSPNAAGAKRGRASLLTIPPMRHSPNGGVPEGALIISF